MTVLAHYSAAPFKGPLRSTVQKPGLDPYGKPFGFWLSVEDGKGWREWCEREQFRMDRCRVRSVVTLKDGHGVLTLAGVIALDAFEQRYGRRAGVSDFIAIDWKQVARDYQGLIIAPYQSERRLTMMWYYCWDCSSGCVWDAAAIATVAGRTAS